MKRERFIVPDLNRDAGLYVASRGERLAFSYGPTTDLLVALTLRGRLFVRRDGAAWAEKSAEWPKRNGAPWVPTTREAFVSQARQLNRQGRLTR